MLTWASKISTKKARAFILDLARFGEGNDEIPPTASDDEIFEWFARNGAPEHLLIEDARNGATIPLIENLLGPDWSTASNDPIFQVGVRNAATGESKMITGPGVLSMSGYHSLFDAARGSLKRAVENASYQDALQALSSGFASLESFVNNRISLWNSQQPHNLLTDSPPYKTFDAKVEEWFPVMMSGQTYDRGIADWSMFKQLRAVRDKAAIHPAQNLYAVDAAEIAEIANGFRLGIATTHFRMHTFFRQYVPTSIIRAMYAPDVILK